MNFPYFIVISGPPATGKTTLGTDLKRHYNVLFIYKDLIKDSLFDTLGIKDSDWSRQLGIASTTFYIKSWKNFFQVNYHSLWKVDF